MIPDPAAAFFQLPAAAADYSPLYPTRSIPASARRVTAVFRLPDEEPHKIAATWTAVDVGAAAPRNYVILKSAPTQIVSKGRLWFSLPRPLPTGKYRLDTEVDGKAWKSADFEVTPDAAAPAVKTPEAMLPLSKGRSWTYDFVQQAGAGAKLRLPDIKPDSQGRYHATVTMTDVGHEGANGDHIEMRRNGRLVFEEWLRVDRNGVSSTKRKADNEVSVLDPAQLLFPWPMAPREWEYAPRDGSYRQTYRMLGPLPIQTAVGERPGYVVMIEQPDGRVDLTVERDFVPGIGMAREIIVTALDHDMLSRQEMTLKPQP